MTEPIRDPVSRVRQTFETRGTPRGLPRGLRGARWAAGFLKRYRDETVFLSPPPAVQKVLIALLARD
jgi:hypothetical protein